MKSENISDQSSRHYVMSIYRNSRRLTGHVFFEGTEKECLDYLYTTTCGNHLSMENYSIIDADEYDKEPY